MMADELNINKETIYQILHEDDGTERSAQSLSHGAEATETHIMPRLHPGLSRQFQFS
jgi:hypothetical protein